MEDTAKADPLLVEYYKTCHGIITQAGESVPQVWGVRIFKKDGELLESVEYTWPKQADEKVRHITSQETHDWSKMQHYMYFLSDDTCVYETLWMHMVINYVMLASKLPKNFKRQITHTPGLVHMGASTDNIYVVDDTDSTISTFVPIRTDEQKPKYYTCQFTADVQNCEIPDKLIRRMRLSHTTYTMHLTYYSSGGEEKELYLSKNIDLEKDEKEINMKASASGKMIVCDYPENTEEYNVYNEATIFHITVGELSEPLKDKLRNIYWGCICAKILGMNTRTEKWGVTFTII